MEVGLWRADGSELVRLSSSGIARESQLEDYIVADPELLGERLLLIGRQVRTAHGGFIDLLAVDEEGNVHVLELKRDKTPRDVVAQTLDYGSWVAGLSHAEVVEIFEEYRDDVAFDVAFAEFFGTTAPEEVNAAQEFTIIAASVDAATERIVRFLNESFDVPVNVVFFRHFDDGGTSYLARTWLVSHEAGPTPREAKTRRTKEQWNGRDWYVSFGEDPPWAILAGWPQVRFRLRGRRRVVFAFAQEPPRRSAYLHAHPQDRLRRYRHRARVGDEILRSRRDRRRRGDPARRPSTRGQLLA